MLIHRLLVTALLAMGGVGLASCGGAAVVAPAESAGAGAGGAESAATTSTGPGIGGGVTGSGASGGRGGMGGGAVEPACELLVQTGALTPVPALPDSLAVWPKLHSLGDGQMAVVSWTGGPPSGKTASTSLSWTEGWPPVAGTPIALHDATGFASPRAHSTANGIALLAAPEATGIGVAFGFADPQQGGWSELVTTDADAAQALFLADDASGTFFVGATGFGGAPGSNPLRVGWVDVNGSATGYVGPLDVGCLDFPHTADAAATPGGWLLAHASSDCTSPALEPKIRVTRFVDEQPQLGAEIEVSGAVQRILVVPRAAGAWLLYWRPSALQAVRLDAFGHVELGPVAIAPMGSAYPFSADVLDGGLVVAVGGDAELTVLITDEQGTKLASAAVPGLSWAKPQVAFDGETRQALAALQLTDGSTHATRFSCQ